MVEHIGNYLNLPVTGSETSTLPKVNQAIYDTVFRELYTMLSRNLDFAPAADELTYTAEVMAKDLQNIGITDTPIDLHRLRVAFNEYGKLATRWPTTSHIKSWLQPRENYIKALPPSEEEERKQRERSIKARDLAWNKLPISMQKEIEKARRARLAAEKAEQERRERRVAR